MTTSAPLPTDASLRARLDHFAEQFEQELRAFCAARGAEQVANLHDAMEYALGTDIADPALRGKRIRPLLCLLTAEALGTDPALAMPFALSIELMHNFALVHDDMEDGDVMRRGRDAAWVRYGTPHAINIGDYLLVQTTAALTEWGPEALPAATRFALLRLIASALDHTHIGQALDMNARNQREFSEADYLRIVREKTGYYLAAPIQGGAIVAGADAATLTTLGELAQVLGPLFQIMDDIIDLTDGKGREAIGSDVREGKRSYLVAVAAARLDAAGRDELFTILDKPRTETTPADVERVLALFASVGAIEAGRAQCDELYERSRAMLTQLPEGLASVLGQVFAQLARRRT